MTTRMKSLIHMSGEETVTSAAEGLSLPGNINGNHTRVAFAFHQKANSAASIGICDLEIYL